MEVSVHPNADKMYVEMIDIGEEKPRQIVSGLREFIPIEQMKDSLIVVFKNLKCMFLCLCIFFVFLKYKNVCVMCAICVWNCFFSIL